MGFDPSNTPFTSLGKLFTDTNPSEIKHLPKSIFQNKAVELRILAKKNDGQHCKEGGDLVLVELKAPTGNTTVGKVRDVGDGSYVALLVAAQVGEAMLTVSINGQRIKGSPFPIKITNNYYQAIDKPTKIIEYEKLGQCWGVGFGDKGVWGVADYSNHCVHLFDGHNQDQFIRSISTKGSGNSEFNGPISLAFDNDSCLYVVDTNNHRVQKFNKEGEFMLAFGSEGSGDKQLKFPFGITTHNSRVYIADSQNRRISVFRFDSHFCTSFGSEWLGDPEDVTVNIHNQLLVTDYEHHCIHIFQLDGHYITKFGVQGSDRGQLHHPRSLTSDSNGHILVVDHNHRVSVFDKDGNFIHCFGSNGSKEGQFSSPYGIAISPKDGIHVCDHLNNRVQIFSIVLD
ncbi:E3 ubiquitin-protein ligase TRIM71-like [Dysidea avara]|uniref:E3 ubiquitin-protein ligase TRIM71-like n=1 Tax=Dysidea avara TaxID=196820 RepID=UPI0033183DC1